MRKKYDTATSTVTTTKQFSLPQRCNSFTIKNIGTTLLFVNNDPLQPFEFKSFEGNEEEEYVGRLDLRFGGLAPGQITVMNMGIVTTKFFVGDNGYDNPRL